jgi:hypothetical protein
MYRPHPMELQAAGFDGPFPRVGLGAAVLAERFGGAFGWTGRALFLLAALGLAVAAIAAAGARTASMFSALGSSALLIGAVVVGAGMPAFLALWTTDVAVMLACAVGVAGTVAGLRRLRS